MSYNQSSHQCILSEEFNISISKNCDFSNSAEGQDVFDPANHCINTQRAIADIGGCSFGLWGVLLWKSLEVFGGCSFGGMLSESLLWSCGHLMTGFKCLPLGDLLPCSLTRSIADLLLLMVMIEASVVRWPTKKSKYEYISLIYRGYFRLLYHPRLSSCCLQIQTWRAHNIPRTKHALYVIGAAIWRLASP